MLGKLVRVCITDPVGSPLSDNKTYKLNRGKPIGKFKTSSPISGVLILGIDNPVKHFDGRVIAILKFRDNGEQKLIASPKSKRFINWEIDAAVKFYTEGRPYSIECYYERSCGAVVFRKINEDYRYLLIRNRRSSNWSFPKGHVEAGEHQNHGDGPGNCAPQRRDHRHDAGSAARTHRSLLHLRYAGEQCALLPPL